MPHAALKPVSVYITLSTKPRQLSSSTASYLYKEDRIEHVRGNLYKVTWDGQRNGGRDDLVEPGVGVFYRLRDAEPFRWLGYVITEKIPIRRRDSLQHIPAVYMFGVKGDGQTNIPLRPPAWHNDKGSGCLKRHAQRVRGYSTKDDVQETLNGIVIHQSGPQGYVRVAE